jgi:cyanamide hydratase
MCPFDQDPISAYGFTPVLSSSAVLIAKDPPARAAPFISVAETPIPTTPLAQRINAYAKAHLPEPTYNHSLRVYHYGLAIKQYRFPEWAFTDETYFLSCLLHDIGTTKGNLRASKLSFEYHGGLIVLDIIQREDTSEVTNPNVIAPKDQAESVAEAVIRHQDLCEKGKITALGQLLQLATIFGMFHRLVPCSNGAILPARADQHARTDNLGLYENLGHPSTIEDVSKHFPRRKWSNCFASTIREEIGLKPWAHTTTLSEEEFPSRVLHNTLMAPYE